MKNIGRAITKIEEFVLSFSVIAMAALLILGVFMRTVMNSSLTFSEEVASALLIVVSFFGLGYCARQGRHITMSIVFDMLNNRQKKVFMIFISLISAIAMVFIVYLAFRYVIHEIEMATQELVKDIFHAKYADLRPIGGHMAGMSVVLAMLEPGDHVIEVSLADWGHGLVAPMCQVRQFDATINVDFMKFTEDREVDVPSLIEQVKRVKPKLVIFGGSGTIFQEPVSALRPLADEMGFYIAYDAAHVTGLIASGMFTNPLDDGADIMFGSTHKSFPGPQGGFVVSNNYDLIQKVGNTLSPSLVTSHHLNRLPALAASILEMKAFGKEYGNQIVKNSKALAQALHNFGFDVQGKNKGYTDSHLLLVNFKGLIEEAPAKLLEQANILVSDDFSGQAPEVRVGTPEVTRRGFKEKDMVEIAGLFKRLIFDREDIEKIKIEVGMMAKKFPGIEYSF